MEICNGNRKVDHDQIVHEDGDCPLCKFMEESAVEISDLKKEIVGLEKDIEKYEGEVEE